MRCPHPGCSWQAIAPSSDGARRSLLEHVTAEHADAGTAVDWFEQPPGHTSEPRSHDRDQVVVVFEGEVVVHTEDAVFELSASDSVRIEAGQRHHSENPGERPCVGLRVTAPGSAP